MFNVWWTWVLLSYLVGSIPFGLLLGLMRGVDIRKAGSGNVGATNAGRVLGRPWGVACFALDVGKGFAPVLTAGVMLGWAGQVDLASGDAWRWLAVAAAAVVGHVFPVWLAFKGGKGVATSLGVLLGFWPTLTLPGLVALATWVLVVLLTRYVSLASVAASLVLPVALLIISLARGLDLASLLPLLCVTTLLAALVVFRHRSNLVRLRQGTESKIGAKDKPTTGTAERLS